MTGDVRYSASWFIMMVILFRVGKRPVILPNSVRVFDLSHFDMMTSAMILCQMTP